MRFGTIQTRPSQAKSAEMCWARVRDDSGGAVRAVKITADYSDRSRNVSMASSAYLFLELSIAAFIVGFGWEHFKLRELLTRPFLVPALWLACFWFAIDQVAVGFGLWTFPGPGTLPFRFLSLPIEEYMLFLLHTVLCFILLKCFSGPEE